MSALQRFRLQGFPFIDTAKDGEDATFSGEVHATLDLARFGTDAITFLNSAGKTVVLRGPEIKTLLLILTGWDPTPRSMLGAGHVPPERPRQPSTREEQLKELVRAEIKQALQEHGKDSANAN